MLWQFISTTVAGTFVLGRELNPYKVKRIEKKVAEAVNLPINLKLNLTQHKAGPVFSTVFWFNCGVVQHPVHIYSYID